MNQITPYTQCGCVGKKNINMDSRIAAIKGIKFCITQRAIRPRKLGALAPNKKHPTQDGSDLHLRLWRPAAEASEMVQACKSKSPARLKLNYATVKVPTCGCRRGIWEPRTGGSTRCSTGGRRPAALPPVVTCRRRRPGGGRRRTHVGGAQPEGRRWPCSPGRDALAAVGSCTGAGVRRGSGRTGGRSAGAGRLGFRPLG
ncbi:hypothetical protein SEVIR_1G283951v4 [Setaria viridis]